MKKLALAAAMLVGLTGAAIAADPVHSDRSGFYVGGNIGSSTDQKNRTNLGMTAGYQYGKYFRVEADYDHAWRTSGTGNMLMGNVVAQYRIPNSTVTPYVLAGAGVGFDKFGNVKSSGDIVGLYNVGAGVRVAVSESVELDARYRNVRPFDTKNVGVKEQNIFTVGANYRF